VFEIKFNESNLNIQYSTRLEYSPIWRTDKYNNPISKHTPTESLKDPLHMFLMSILNARRAQDVWLTNGKQQEMSLG
jgi:hypothetical protein